VLGILTTLKVAVNTILMISLLPKLAAFAVVVQYLMIMTMVLSGLSVASLF
jgi:hypothetical protein